MKYWLKLIVLAVLVIAIAGLIARRVHERQRLRQRFDSATLGMTKAEAIAILGERNDVNFVNYAGSRPGIYHCEGAAPVSLLRARRMLLPNRYHLGVNGDD